MAQRPDPKAVVDNLRSGKGFFKTLGQALKNNLIKLKTGSHCCGHPGEPGC